MARIAIRNALFFGSTKATTLTIPWCTYTEPEVAHVGLYESDAIQAGMQVKSFTKELWHNDRAILEGTQDGYVRIMVKEVSLVILNRTNCWLTWSLSREPIRYSGRRLCQTMLG